jgi:serine phosphatase RsbU (regulator of sigma subunit)
VGEQYYNKALRIFKRTSAKHRVSSLYRDMAKFLHINEDFERAYLYLDSHLVAEREVINENILKDMDVIKSRHAAENSALKVKNLQIENELKEEHNRQQDLIRYGLISVLLLLVLFALFIVWKFIQKKKDNSIISQQKKEVEEQKRQVEFQKDILHEKNMEITDSITYAKRLQSAILPHLDEFRALFENGFLLYMPKDIVAGDFYWTQSINDRSFFAVADCTGHGVPGALVSVVCSNALNRAVKEFKVQEPHLILEKTSDLVESTFQNNDEDVKDGMDIALCCFDHTTKELFYSGANNNLYLVANSELVEYKSANRPIGAFGYKEKFNTQKIPYLPGDMIFLFSDGYADQFGGERGKKFKYANFKKLIVENVHLEMDKQQELFRNTIEDWRGDIEQIDDICLMGIRF